MSLVDRKSHILSLFAENDCDVKQSLIEVLQDFVIKKHMYRSEVLFVNVVGGLEMKGVIDLKFSKIDGDLMLKLSV